MIRYVLRKYRRNALRLEEREEETTTGLLLTTSRPSSCRNSFAIYQDGESGRRTDVGFKLFVSFLFFFSPSFSLCLFSVLSFFYFKWILKSVFYIQLKMLSTQLCIWVWKAHEKECSRAVHLIPLYSWIFKAVKLNKVIDAVCIGQKRRSKSNSWNNLLFKCWEDSEHFEKWMYIFMSPLYHEIKY